LRGFDGDDGVEIGFAPGGAADVEREFRREVKRVRGVGSWGCWEYSSGGGIFGDEERFVE
jgi:hypothetical protein